MLREATGAEPREELHRLPPELAGELLDWPTRSFWRTDCSKTRWRRPRTPSETSLDARAIGWCAWRLAQTLDGASWRAHDGNIVSTAAGPVLVHLSRQPVMGRAAGVGSLLPLRGRPQRLPQPRRRYDRQAAGRRELLRRRVVPSDPRPNACRRKSRRRSTGKRSVEAGWPADRAGRQPTPFRGYPRVIILGGETPLAGPPSVAYRAEGHIDQEEHADGERSLSRACTCVLTLAASKLASMESKRRSASSMTSNVPRNDVERPSTRPMTRCRARKLTNECTGSMSYVPATGRQSLSRFATAE
jgi:hypothetical protein